MALLTKELFVDEADITWNAAATSGGDTIAFEQNLLLIFWNDGGAGAKQVTITSHATAQPGLSVANKVVDVAVDEMIPVVISSNNFKNPTGSLVNLNYDTPADLKVAVLTIS